MKHESSWPVGGLVHTSTYPILKGGSLSPKEKANDLKKEVKSDEACSSSSQPQVLRDQTK